MTIKSAADFGHLVRQKRKAVGLTQEQLATRCGVGVRFIVDLEAGKPSCQLSKSITAAVEVGIKLADLPQEDATSDPDDSLAYIPKF